MKKNLNDFKRLLLTACCTLVLSCGWATVNEKPFVIPELKQWSGLYPCQVQLLYIYLHNLLPLIL